MKYQLTAPDSYWTTPQKELAEICNGGGPEYWPDWVRKILDSSIFCYGVCLRPAFDIHDFEYEVGNTQEDKNKADKNFLANMRVLIRAYTPWYEYPLLPLRLHRARQVYLAVKFGGHHAFWTERKYELFHNINAPDHNLLGRSCS